MTLARRGGKTEILVTLFDFTYYTIHYTTQYTPVQYTPVQYTPVQYTPVQYTPVQYTAIHYTVWFPPRPLQALDMLAKDPKPIEEIIQGHLQVSNTLSPNTNSTELIQDTNCMPSQLYQFITQLITVHLAILFEIAI